ncbi:hypothetical protein ACLKA7_002136 [Drosophila subpalustris]
MLIRPLVREAHRKLFTVVVGLFVTCCLVKLYSTPLRIDPFDTFTTGNQRPQIVPKDDTAANKEHIPSKDISLKKQIFEHVVNLTLT